MIANIILRLMTNCGPWLQQTHVKQLERLKIIVQQLFDNCNKLENKKRIKKTNKKKPHYRQVLDE